ncbi:MULTISPECIES: hypothetical protein [Flavobacterium]|jgi:hypothetical protein|nr:MULTISPECIES: hypothetical protein [Flavobacterium]
MKIFLRLGVRPYRAKKKNVLVHSASHHAIAKALSEQQVCNTYVWEQFEL